MFRSEFVGYACLLGLFQIHADELRIEAQCRNFTSTKNENKLSQIAYNDVKWNENKALWSKNIKSL